MILGNSSQIQALRKRVELAAKSDCPVLILGETGTGKELVARMIHRLSKRERMLFVPINCGAIPESLIEDELFGHVKGGYTDASSHRVGRLEEVGGGTVLLDEIGTMRQDHQCRLLRVLEEREFSRIGAAEKIAFDGRVIAATNESDIKEAGKFRRDLYYRLAVLVIQVPALRDHAEDVPELATKFLPPSASITDRAMSLLQTYNWPGNVRELRNVIESAAILAGESEIDLGHLEGIAVDVEKMPEFHLHWLLERVARMGIFDCIHDIEKSLMVCVLEHNQSNHTKTAEALKLKRTTLIEAMNRLGIPRRERGMIQ